MPQDFHYHISIGISVNNQQISKYLTKIQKVDEISVGKVPRALI